MKKPDQLSPAILSSIVKNNSIAYLVFDSNLFLLDSKNVTLIHFSSSPAKGIDLWTILPQFVGYESIIEDLLHGRKRQYRLEKLNQPDSTGTIKYFDVLLTTFKPGAGAGMYLLCQFIDVTMVAAMQQDLRQRRYEIELMRAKFQNRGDFLAEGLLGNSREIRDTRKYLEKVSAHNTTVLLQGDSGTGKSLAARLIHNLSDKSNGPLVEINCAAIPATLLESELFGYEKGAFTNALLDKKGLLQEADGGTLFLDEIGELPPSLQAKLLTFLETRRFRRLGSTKEQSVELRLIAATNKDLYAAVKNSEFREDLFYRINVVTVVLPALKDLGDDVLLLAHHFVSLLGYDFKKKVTGFTESASNKLLNYSWPGNVRELRNVIERSLIFAEGHNIDADDILLQSQESTGGAVAEFDLQIPDTGLRLEHVEKSLIEAALKRSRGNQSRSAELLGLTLDAFRYRMKKFNTNPEDYK